ncbi:MAG: phospho-N-acetylmuramoyl-pentapeptide-transferase [Spirochaetia bacterium]
MLNWLLYPLVKYHSFFNIFQYITFRAIYAAVTALMISFIFGPFIIRMLAHFKFGQSIRDNGPASHLAKKGTPTMGGAMMIVSVVLSTLLWQNLNSYYTWLLLFALVSFGGLGFLDDYLKIKKANSDGISAKIKSIGQLTISATLVILLFIHSPHFYKILQLKDYEIIGLKEITMLYVPLFKNLVIDLSWLYIPFGIFLLVGTSNATNLTDGLDGLLTGLLILAFGTFAIIAYSSGHSFFASYLHIPYIPEASELTIPIMAILGSCIGFLWFNSHPASVFMGDTGSLSFGGVLGLLAMMLKRELLLIVIGGVFVLETLSVIIQVGYFRYTKKKYGMGRRVFKMAPLHHHYEQCGWSETKVVARFWILGGLFSLIALSTLKIN